MANYIINECLTNDVYILSASTLTEGATVEFDISEERFCGTVGSETSSGETLNISFISLRTDCCVCLSGLTESLNFKFIQCGTSGEIYIEATNFCEQFGAPTIGVIYGIKFGSDASFCATFDKLTLTTGTTNYSYFSGGFANCEDCIPPISAGTEYNVCIIDCSGNTVSITPPHPTWTNEQGHAVVLLDAIALGGMNGLNS
jgi:hypothetical protein